MKIKQGRKSRKLKNHLESEEKILLGKVGQSTKRTSTGNEASTERQQARALNDTYWAKVTQCDTKE